MQHFSSGEREAVKYFVRKGGGALSPNPGHYKKLKVDQKQNRMQVYAKKLYFT